MTKSELKTGDILFLADGNRTMVLKNDIDDIMIYPSGGYDYLSLYSEQLEAISENKDYYEIKYIYRPTRAYHFAPDNWAKETAYKQMELIYKKPVVVEMTLEEICAELGKTVKIVKSK